MNPQTTEVPAGRWAVGVSGGVDSVALLLLLHSRPDLELHIVHLDHQTRGQASTDDASFVVNLAENLGVPATLCRRDEIEPAMESLPNNPSARYRAVRLELFRRVVAQEKLNGVILAHQADDQAETILLRLLRGSGPTGFAGMKERRQIGNLTVLRPLLGIRRRELRGFLVQHGQEWREDASNESDQYARNRVRRFLQSRPELHEPILAVGRASAKYSRWINDTSPKLKDEFPAIALSELPRMLARESAHHWLKKQGVPEPELSVEVSDRLRQMSTDAATPARQEFPGKIMIHRQRGWIARR